MTADSGSGQAPSNAKYLLLLVVVVLALVIFTWFTTSPGKSDADFDRLLNAGKTYYDSGEAQKAIEAFAGASTSPPRPTCCSIWQTHTAWPTNPRRSSSTPARRWLSTITSPGISHRLRSLAA